MRSLYGRRIFRREAHTSLLSANGNFRTARNNRVNDYVALVRYEEPQRLLPLDLAVRDCVRAFVDAVGLTGEFVDFLGDPTTAPDATCIDNMSIEFFLPSSAYVDPEGQFTSALPAGWDDAGDRTLVNPENGSKMVFEVVAGDDVLEGIGTAISTYDSSVDGASPLNAQDIDLANGTWKLTFYLSGSRYYIVVGIVQNGNVFVVILETNESQFENDANAVQEVLDAMSFTDGNGSVSVTPTPS